MAHQIKPSVTNPTLADIYEKIDEGRLVLAPDFQRKFVWTQEHQEEFLDTILHGFPFPEIYVCQGDTDTKRLRTTQKVIDGQQRLTTIRNYIDNAFDKGLKKIPAFDTLDEDRRESFLTYQIVVRDIGKVDDAVVREIFRRINLTKFKLDDIEIHNAIYDGQFIRVAKDLAEEVALEDFGVFHESEFTRMADVHFFLLVMATIVRGGYFPRDKEVEKCVAEFNEEFSEAHRVKAQILKSVAFVQDAGLQLDSIWFRKSCFFTMVVELSGVDGVPEDFLERLNYFDSEVLASKNRKDTDHGSFYHAMYSGTNDRKTRILRSEMFRKYILA